MGSDRALRSRVDMHIYMYMKKSAAAVAGVGTSIANPALGGGLHERAREAQHCWKARRSREGVVHLV